MLNKAQRLFYLGLWEQACTAQGWDPRDKQFRQNWRANFLRVEKSFSLLSNEQFTKLKNELLLLADPTNLQVAKDAVTPDLDERRRLAHSCLEKACYARFMMRNFPLDTDPRTLPTEVTQEIEAEAAVDVEQMAARKFRRFVYADGRDWREALSVEQLKQLQITIEEWKRTADRNRKFPYERKPQEPKVEEVGGSRLPPMAPRGMLPQKPNDDIPI